MCYNYGSVVKDASKNQQRMVDQLRGLEKVLDAVYKLAVDEEDKPTSHLPKLTDVLNDPQSGLERCRKTLQSLKTKLDPPPRRFDIRRLIWPLKEGDMNKDLEYLGKFQRNLEGAILIDQTYVLRSQHENNSEPPDRRVMLTMREDMNAAMASSEQAREGRPDIDIIYFPSDSRSLFI